MRELSFNYGSGRPSFFSVMEMSLAFQGAFGIDVELPLNRHFLSSNGDSEAWPPPLFTVVYFAL